MSSTVLSQATVKTEVPEELEACRICLCWDEKLYSIHECGLNEMYCDLSGITQSAWDGLPQLVCAWCRAQLVKAHALRARSRRADELLKQALVQQHFVTNSYIRSIDRSMHKLTCTLSTRFLNNDADFYYNYEYYDPQTQLYDYRIDNNKEIYEEKELDLSYVKNYDIHNDSNSDKEIEQDEINFKFKNISKRKENCVNVEIIECVDSKHKRLQKKKRVTKKINVKKKKVTEIISQDETSLDKDVTHKETKSIHRRKQRRKEKEDNATKRKKKKSCTEEDFKEFEKKYDFQVQSLTEEDMEREMQKRKESDKYLKGEYKCELCYKGFLTAATYENHMKTHDPARGEHACRLCQLRYQFPVKLRQHVQNAHRLKFRCAKCNELVRGKACAVLHAAYHAGATFKCAHCDKQFLKKTSRTSHMRMAHPVENAAGGTCEVCGETFTSRTGLKAHKTRSHKKANLPELKCRKCRTQFDNLDALKRHKEMYADNKCDSSVSACEACGATCSGADDLIRHRHEQHAVELFTCDTCTKSFTSKASLATHIDRIHRRIRPPKADYSDGGRRKQPDWLHWASVCEHCGKRLSCLATLKIHMNKHTGERPYKCSLCPKAYMTPYGLNNHQAFHTGVRKWQCPECPATFMHQSSVYQHRKIHTGERSHQCTICDKYFTQSGSLYTHVKYVHMKETPPPRKRHKKPVPQ